MKPMILVYVDGGRVMDVVGAGIEDVEVAVIDLDIEGCEDETIQSSAGEAMVYTWPETLSEADAEVLEDVEKVRNLRTQCRWTPDACSKTGVTKWRCGCGGEFETDHCGSGGRPDANWRFCPACAREITFDVVSC